MSNLPGVNIIAPVVPYSEADEYPTHDEKYGKGGYRAVENKTERDSIKRQRLVVGMAVRTRDDNVVWILNSIPAAGQNLTDSNWTKETIDVDTLSLDGGQF
jgi:hypothetical protein